ncbi:MAG TPA: 5'-3' exonuclease H3TH domain-containing protein [Myxococcales bacterium]|jgi:5'-3' exonuclease|nr:5'-3' exonuclease H3TH domain-containing protein [Myxococcales bacterium]
MRLHLVDGTYELFRAFYSKRPPHRAPDGTDKKATLALAASILSLLQDADEAVTHVAVAFDNPIRSFRNDLFDGYKTEDGVPRELLDQFDPAEEAMRAIGVAVWSMRDFEADDALATGAARFAPDVEQVRILTPDKDLGQCLRGTHVVQVDWRARTIVDEEALLRRRGVQPGSVPDWLALTGDDADGIPGLPGFGEKTASALLAKFIHLEGIPGDPRTWPAVRQAPRLAATLEAQRDDAILYRRLATLRTDAPIGSLEETEFKGVPRERFLAFCDAIGTTELRGRPNRWSA